MVLNATSVGVGRRNFLCACSRNCIFIVIIIIIVAVVVMVMFQNHQVIVTSLGCCWYSGGTPRVPIVVAAMPGGRWVQEDRG